MIEKGTDFYENKEIACFMNDHREAFDKQLDIWNSVVLDVFFTEEDFDEPWKGKNEYEVIPKNGKV